MLDAVVDYLPSPLDVEAIKGIEYKNEENSIVRNSSDDEPFSALAFKDYERSICWFSYFFKNILWYS